MTMELLTPAEDQEVFVLDWNQREGILNLQEEVATW